MEAIRKQASKLREQVAKQQQAVLRQLGHFGNDAVVIDEAELQCHEQLQNLYNSTRAAKHFQRNIVRGVESFISSSSKQMEIVRKLAEDCWVYGNENQSSPSGLANAALQFGTAHKLIEEEREDFISILGPQVSEPLRASISGAPLDDARHLTRQYDRIRQEVDSQAAEVTRRRLKCKEAGTLAEADFKLQNAEAKLEELKSSMMAMGREAVAAMSLVEAHQQKLTFERLLTMANAERSYHHTSADILEKLHAKMIIEKQQMEFTSEPVKLQTDGVVQPTDLANNSHHTGDVESGSEDTCFIAEVIHPFDAQADGELSLSIGDYIVVRQVSLHGWAEGECMGKAGWFPSAYIEKRDKAPQDKVTELSSLPWAQ